MVEAMSRTGIHQGTSTHPVLPWFGALVAMVVLALLGRRLDWRLFADTLAGSRVAFVIAIFLAIVLG
jgi:hypothetical protein